MITLKLAGSYGWTLVGYILIVLFGHQASRATMMAGFSASRKFFGPLRCTSKKLSALFVMRLGQLFDVQATSIAMSFFIFYARKKLG